MAKNNFTILVLLILLTSASFFFSSESGGKLAILLLTLFTILKVFLVAFQFMELKKAHFTIKKELYDLGDWQNDEEKPMWLVVGIKEEDNKWKSRKLR